MEPYYNMNPRGGRGCNNPYGPGCRPGMRPGCPSCPDMKPQMPQKTGCQTCPGKKNPRGGYHNMHGLQSNETALNANATYVCKVTPNTGCHKSDAMDQLGKDFPPVMAYVPWQQWKEPYPCEEGLKRGTIFADLDLKFCGVRY